MSNVKKSVKSKKTAIVADNCEVFSIPQEPKVVKLPRKSRAKKIPTKEEALKLLSDTSIELKQIIQDLKEDEMKISGMQLKKVPELIKEKLCNLDEDLNEIEEQHQELLTHPEKISYKLLL